MNPAVEPATAAEPPAPAIAAAHEIATPVMADATDDQLERLKAALILLNLNSQQLRIKHSQESTLPILQKAAKEGCGPAGKYAKLLQLFKSVVDETSQLVDLVITTNEPGDSYANGYQLQEQIVLNLAQIIKIDFKLLEWTPHLQNTVSAVCLMVFRRQNKQSSSSELDKSARICQLHMNLKTPDSKYQFANECIKKYPQEPFFHFIKGFSLGCLEKFELGAKLSTRALKKFPDSLDLMYNKATFLKYSPSSTHDEQLDAWAEYLKHADKRDRHVSEFHYEIGNSTIFNKIGDNVMHNPHALLPGGCKTYTRALNIGKIEYMKGVEAEKDILPCNVAQEKIYFAPVKAFLVDVISTAELTKNNFQYEDPAIVDTILEHRLMIGMNNRPEIDLEDEGEKRYMLTQMNRYVECIMFAGMKPDVKKVSVSKLKPILIKELKEDLKNDGFYPGRIIKLMSIEPVVICKLCESQRSFGTYLSLAVEDGKGDVMKVYILNYDHEKMSSEGKGVQDILGVGCKFSIINPFVQSFILYDPDDVMFILVDNPSPKSVILHEDERVDRACRYCLVENAPLHCSKCKTAYYCDPYCQKKDWKDLGHKSICSPFDD